MVQSTLSDICSIIIRMIIETQSNCCLEAICDMFYLLYFVMIAQLCGKCLRYYLTFNISTWEQ